MADSPFDLDTPDPIPQLGVFPAPPINTDPIEPASIVDELLDLDEFLAADIRLAEKTARICTRPDLEARFDELEAELLLLVDAAGRPLEDQAMGGRTATVVANESQAVQREMAASMRRIVMRQLPEDEWQAYCARNKAALAQEETPPAVFDELVIACAKTPTFTTATWAQFMARVGHAAVDEVRLVAWHVNLHSGVAVPKSRLSSAVLKHSRPDES